MKYAIIKNFIKYFIMQLIIVYFLLMIFFDSNCLFLLNNIDFVFLVPLVATSSLLCFTKNKLSLVFNMLLLLLTSLTIPIIFRFFSHQVLTPQNLITEITLPFLWFAILTLLHTIILLEHQNNAFLNMIFLFPQFIYMSIQLITFILFLATKSIFSDFTILAIYQSNIYEASSFVKETFSLPEAVFFLSSLYIFYFIMKKAMPTQKNISLTFNNKASIIFIGILLLISIYTYFASTQHSYIVQVFKNAQNTILSYKEFQKQKSTISSNITTKLIKSDPKPRTYILIIGESANRNHLHAYGYKRETTPWLSSMIKNPNLILLKKAYANDHGTVPALSYALTAKNQYNNINLEQAYSLIDVANAAGFDTIWLSNQKKYGVFDTPISVIAESAKIKIWLNNNVGDKILASNYDEIVIEYLKTLNNQINKTKNNLIVIHLMGSHKSYQERYPYKFNKFFSNENIDASLIKNLKQYNAYDNSVFYNDYVMSKIYELTKTNLSADVLLYFSDHGEEVINGYAHNSINNDFELAMVEIPMYIYLSDQYIKENTSIYENLTKHKNYYFTNDMIFDTMLGIMHLQLGKDTSQYDLSSLDYNLRLDTLKTIHGKSMLKDKIKHD